MIFLASAGRPARAWASAVKQRVVHALAVCFGPGFPRAIASSYFPLAIKARLSHSRDKAIFGSSSIDRLNSRSDSVQFQSPIANESAIAACASASDGSSSNARAAAALANGIDSFGATSGSLPIELYE